MWILFFLAIIIFAIVRFRKSNLFIKMKYDRMESQSEEFASAFCNSILDNNSVLAMADILCKDIVVWINQKLKYTQKNEDSDDTVLVMCGLFVSCPSGVHISLPKFGLQQIEDPHKIYGLAKALCILVNRRLVLLAIPSVAELKLRAVANYFYGTLSESAISLHLSWHIRQNKFVEL